MEEATEEKLVIYNSEMVTIHFAEVLDGRSFKMPMYLFKEAIELISDSFQDKVEITFN